MPARPVEMPELASGADKTRFACVQQRYRVHWLERQRFMLCDGEGDQQMEMRATIGIFGRRIVWAAITLGLLVLAGVRVVPARSSVSMKLADSYHLDSHCLSPYLTQEEIDEYMQHPGYFPEGPTPGYNPRATLEAVFGESIIWSYYEPVTHPVRTLDLSNVDDPDADPPVHYGDGASIRYSFVAGPLFTELQRPGRFPNNPDRGLEMIRQGMAAWSRNSGLFLTEVADPSGDIVNSPPNASDTSDLSFVASGR
jgi:hypothetical protein